MYEFAHTGPVTVSLRALAGTVDIDAGDHETVQVSVVALDDADGPETRVLLDGDTLVVHTADPHRWLGFRTPAQAITIRVPADSTLTGRSAAADIHATGRYATVRLDTASAAVSVSHVTGDAHITAASGTVTVDRVDGALSVKASSGRLRLGDVAGDVTADTASGDITVANAGGSLRAGSASGTVAIGTVRQGHTKIRTASGDVTVGVAAGTGVWLDLETTSGRSTNDLAGGASAPAGGGLEMRVRTVSGDIHIHRAAADLKAA